MHWRKFLKYDTSDFNGHYDAKIRWYEAMMRIREQKNIPIILVSAKTEDTDKIIRLNMGADDYITKLHNPLN